MKKIIYTDTEGRLWVVTPHINKRRLVDGVIIDQPEDITEDQALERSVSRLPSGIDYQIVDESAIPQDRTFRDAWKAGNGKVEHDMGKCRELHRERLRDLRKPKLDALDVDFMRALESGAPTGAITAKKQALRDVTSDPRLDAAQTVEELKLVIPSALL